MRGKTIAKIVGVVVIVGAVYGYFKDDIAKLWADLHPQIAEYPQPKKTVWLDQNVSKEKLSWFYHADQGTRTFGIPYEWFMALEQPALSLVPFASPGCSATLPISIATGSFRIPIIPGKTALPIGFAQGGPMLDPSGAPWRNPSNKQEMTGIGLTCAAAIPDVSPTRTPPS